jgi:hypothetical protein
MKQASMNSSVMAAASDRDSGALKPHSVNGVSQQIVCRFGHSIMEGRLRRLVADAGNRARVAAFLVPTAAGGRCR